MNFYKITSLVVLILFYSFANAQRALKYSNDFLNIGVGARAAAMGGSVIASTNDVTAGYWNPAALLRIEDKLQVSAMHNEQFAGVTKHDYGAISFGLNAKSKAAVSVVRLGIDGIPNTLYLMQDGQINYALIRTFSAVDYAVIGSYATQTPIEGLNVGGNIKIIRRIVGEFGGAWGFGLDVGSTYTKNNWQFAFTGRDITGTFNAWSFNLSEQDQKQLLAAGNALPKGGLEITLPRFTFGSAYILKMFDDKFSILPEVNFDLTTDGQRNVLINSKIINIDPRAGIELGYKNFAFLRGGISNMQSVTDFSGKRQLNAMPAVGVGIKLKSLAIDYALGNAFNEGILGMSNIISLRLSINPKTNQ
ncbi:MAG: hypothetical protein ACK4K9_00820 [Bacteroidia bacterium]